MAKKLIIGALVLVLLGVTYFGMLNYKIQKADAEEAITYKVMTALTTDYGYVPRGEFEMSKPSLEAHIKLCWWDAAWLDSGDLLLRFEVGEGKSWFVKLIGNDPEIKTLKKMVNEYGLKCSIPDR